MKSSNRKQKLKAIIVFLLTIQLTHLDMVVAGKKDYKYDALGRLVEVQDAVNGGRSYSYDDAGNRKKVSTISANSINTNPSAVNDLARATKYMTANISPLLNDSDSDGDSLFISGLKNAPSFCNVSTTKIYISCRFTSEGLHRFSYVISDGNGGSAQADIAVWVTSSSDDIILK